MIPDFDPSENELKGRNLPLRYGELGGPVFNRPISPRDNFMRVVHKDSPYWMPVVGMRGWDLQVFRPRMFPDNVATHLVYDAEPQIKYDSMLKKGWFGLEWEYVPVAGGATVHPGHPMVPSMVNWEDYISIPSTADFDWAGSAEINKDFLNTDNVREIAFLSCLWERLISLMDVENAAMALVDEDEQEGIHRFFSRMCDLYDEMIEKSVEYYNIDMVLWHDDWGTQRGPFFSVETHREMILPYIKRIIDSCHKRGVLFELHSCGKNERFVPLMIEAGVDLWCGQGVNDFDMLAHTYKDENIIFGVTCPTFGPDDSADDKKRAAEDILRRYEGCQVALNCLFAYPDEEFGNIMYEYSRKAYSA